MEINTSAEAFTMCIGADTDYTFVEYLAVQETCWNSKKNGGKKFAKSTVHHAHVCGGHLAHCK